MGIKIFTNCAARGLETQAGVISDVVTEKKDQLKPRVVVVAGGVWSRLFMQNLNVDVPTLPAYQSQQLISAAPNAPGGNVALPGGIFFREQADGTYATSPSCHCCSGSKKNHLLTAINIYLCWLYLISQYIFR